MTVTNTVETQIAADVAGYIAGIHAATEELDKFIKKNLQAGQVAKKSKGGLDDFAKGAANFIKQNRTLGDVVKSAGSAIAGINPVAALAVAGITAIGTASVLAAKQAIALADELQAVSQRTGTSTEALSALKIAAEDANVSFGSVQAGLRSLNRTIAAAEGGNKAARESFKDLGIQLRDANDNLKTTDQIFREVAETVSKIEGPALKAGASAKVFGRQAGPELVPLLDKGIAGMEAAREKAEAFGNVITARFAKQADEFGTNLKDIGRLAEGVGISLAEAFLPALNAVLEAFTAGALADMKDFRDAIADIGFETFHWTQLLIALKAQLDLLGKSRFVIAAQFTGTGRPDLALKALRGEIGPTEKEIARLNKVFEDAAAASFKTKAEFLALGKAKPAPDVKPIIDAKTALQNLAEAFKDLDKEAIAPVLAVARELASVNGVPAITASFTDLITELQRMAKESPVAAKALAEVLKLRQELIAAELQASAIPQGPATEGGQGPQRVTPATIQQGIAAGLEQGPLQGPATREGQGPQQVEPGGFQLAPETFGGREGEVQGPATEAGEAAKRMDTLAESTDKVHEAFVNAQLASDAFFESTIDFTQVAFQAMQNFASTFADAMIDGANLAKLAFGKLFAQILKDLAKAIIRALVLKAILGVFNFVGLGAITNLLTQGIGGAAAKGATAFQDRESSITARASQARGLNLGAGGLAGAGLAANAAPGVTVQIHEPGPFTWAEATDRKVLPRLRERQRRLNEQPL